MATGKTLSKVQMPNAQFQSIQFLDHRLYAVFNQSNQPFKVYDAMTGQESRTLEGSSGLFGGTAVALSPDRRLLALGAQRGDRIAPDGRLLPNPGRSSSGRSQAGQFGMNWAVSKVR